MPSQLCVNSKTPICKCIIADRDGDSLLLQRCGETWQLPAFSLPPQSVRFFAGYVQFICDLAYELWGIRAIVLRQLNECEGVYTCELELQGISNPTAIDGQCRWLQFSELAKQAWGDPQEKADVEAWLPGESLANSPVLHAPWERKGWYSKAVDWFARRIEERGYQLHGQIDQIKGAWGWSSILCAETSAGRLFFKAGYHKPPFEVKVIEKLSQRWPLNVPTIVTADQSRNWMILADFGDVRFESLSPTLWFEAVRTYAQMQQESAGDLEAWQTLGVADFSVASLLTSFEILLGDETVLAVGDDALQSQEVAEARKCLVKIAVACECVAQSNIPLTLMSDDFRVGNIAFHNGTYVFYDWANTTLSHPFFSMNYFLNRMPRSNDASSSTWRFGDVDGFRAELLNTYLEVWRNFEQPLQANDTFANVRRLFSLHECIRCYRDLPYLEPTTPWAIGTASYVRRCVREIVCQFGE